MMDYKAIIPYKVKDLVSLIMENKEMKFLNAVDYLYNTKLYEYLSNEESKFWHFSTYKLFDLLEQEAQNDFFEFPDFV